MKRIATNILKLDPRLKDGYYSDRYFVRAREIVLNAKLGHKVRMQIFQRNDNACLCGVAEAVAMIEDTWSLPLGITVSVLPDGSIINAWETVMLIEGLYSRFGHLETVILGALARGTKIATNVHRCFKAANGKPVLFFPARFDSHLIQAKDGYSYKIGREAAGFDSGGISTDAQGEWWGSAGMGTMPHALIAIYGGDTVKAALEFAKYAPKEYCDKEGEIHVVKRIVLVDFDNNCVKTTLAVAEAMLAEYKKTRDIRYTLHGIRLDTSGNMVDESIQKNMESHEYLGSFKPTGVNPQLVHNVFCALRNKRNQHEPGSLDYEFYHRIGITVSGGFNAEKIAEFERLKAPVSVYAVGSSLLKGNFDFTADIVQIDRGRGWEDCAKKGRRYIENSRLERII